MPLAAAALAVAAACMASGHGPPEALRLATRQGGASVAAALWKLDAGG